MKTLKIKAITGFAFMVLFATTSFGQATTKSAKESMKKPVKIEKAKVPKEVTKSYFLEYPEQMDDFWYGYPAYDYGNYWYEDWYNPYVDVEYPEYFVTEFTKDNVPHKVVYSKAGEKIAVHKSVVVTPKAISDAISKGEYKTWKLGKENEEIFRDKDSDQLKIYEITVEKGKEKHNLFFQSDGKLLKDKKVS